MEFNSNMTRAVAIELKEKFMPHFMKVNAMYAEIGTWILHCSPDNLPAPYDVKVQLQQYADLKTEALELASWAEKLMDAQIGDTLTTMPPCGDTSGSGLFDGSATFDGTTTFDGGA